MRLYINLTYPLIAKVLEISNSPRARLPKATAANYKYVKVPTVQNGGSLDCRGVLAIDITMRPGPCANWQTRGKPAAHSATQIRHQGSPNIAQHYGKY